MELDGVVAESPTDIANLFVNFFKSVYSTVKPPVRPNSFHGIQENDLNFPVPRFTPDAVQNVLRALDESKSAGVDGLPPAFLKHCAGSLALPISCIFNKSLVDRAFPSLWKTASIVPIHKSGNRSQIKNYRGISLLSCISKVFETLMHDTLYCVVQPIISQFQHGFVRNRSTTTNLMCYTNMLFQEVEHHGQVDSVYIDFSKAFDTVPHEFACKKLEAMGLPDWIVQWILSYLSDRKAFVSVNSTRSDSFTITSGVPQGSVLGPLIFVLFVNDLCPRILSHKQFFADDLKLYRVIASALDCLALQNDIDELLVWCNENGMCINRDKCRVISFSRRGAMINHSYNTGSVHLERVSSIRDLGVIIDSKLRFNEHVALITSKAFAVLGFIRRYTWQVTDIYAQKALYCALVRPLLEYAAPIWAPYHTTLILRVERIQRQFIRFALRNLPWNDPIHLPDYRARCALINLETLDARRKTSQQILIFDLLNGITDCPQLLQEIPLYVPPRQLRNTSTIALPLHRTVYGQNNPLCACLRAFNEIGDSYDPSISKLMFKNRIKNRILLR